ncbi:MAG: AAA domain-containing protein [Thermodesulfobacteriota bacterium]
METISNTESGITEGIQGFAQHVLRYFLTFLETDFKRQQAPRRRIQLKNESGFRTGIPLRKYPSLYVTIWKFAEQTIGASNVIRIPRGRHTAPVSPILRDLIHQHVGGLPVESFEKVRQQVLEYAKRNRSKAVNNPEKYVEDVQLAFVEAVEERVVGPILALLDGPFRQQAYSLIESVYEVERDLADLLTLPTLTQLPSTINTYIVRGDLGPAEAILRDVFSEKETKERIVSFFEDFATVDAFQEVRDLINYAHTADNLQFYLYLCELRFGTSMYPIFYIPGSVRFDEGKGEYVLEFDPHLFVNKRAIDYVIQEQKSETEHLPISPVEDRIIYLNESQSFINEMEKVWRRLIPAFELVGDIDLRNNRIQTVSSASLRFSNSAYFAVFEKSDEALLNDYEALLAAVNEDQKSASNLFENIIHNFLLDNPKTVRQKIDDQWENMPILDRLVAVSPIPVNEEQRKILAALRDPECRYLAIQGPPGTGKSHTITAIAFDCILKGSNILILSDKQEALDVVQEKLENALSAVRHGEDFPNPILRLGKSEGSYGRLISQSSQERIRQQYRAHKSNAEQLERDTVCNCENLKKEIQKTIRAYSDVNLPEIEELHSLEEEINKTLPDFSLRLREPKKQTKLSLIEKAMAATSGDALIMALNFFSKQFTSGTVLELLTLAREHAVAAELSRLRLHREALLLFTALGPQHQPVLTRFINEYESLKLPLFGYLFRRQRLRSLNIRMGQELPCANTLDIHKRLADMRKVAETLQQIRQAVSREKLSDKNGETIYQMLLLDRVTVPGLSELKNFIEVYLSVWGSEIDDSGTPVAVDGLRFTTVENLVGFMIKAARYGLLWQKVKKSIESAPVLDYVGGKSKLEKLYTSKIALEIDRRFIDFVDNKRTDAKILGAVIKAKQQFPQTTFENLRDAFPCIIASIREFSEYVPLRNNIFDVVVIDEASQVSVAQAFPALLRAKKVCVFGDRKQFNNVKSMQASNMLNAGYLTGIESYFRAKIATAADKIQRLKQFDVKKSILEFFDLIASYADMLRKHFRGYQELISFSSKYFYEGQLQAIKVRGKPIEEVICFTVLKGDEIKERYQNVNTREAEFILSQLKEMVEEEVGMTVGVITPFREQQQHLTRILFGDTYAERFESELRLKIMTFDTCQGEEREVIFYSMVATPKYDALNYVFPVDLESAVDRVEETLKMQRLNVGFSRAKETIHFVLSKPVEQFHGSIGRVLSHYKYVLEQKKVPEPQDTDPLSPMERKVLDWIQKTPFFQRNEDRVELIAQFPIGDYLRQLDPFYNHPAYRCDFLMHYHGADKTLNVVIEYDGFSEHFVEHKKIHEGNYQQYYRPEDIERQMVIESYGYKFLRLNRFNLGRNPVETLSKRLYALINEAKKEDENPEVVTRIRTTAEEQAAGNLKHCRKCEQLKPLKNFWDPRLKGGEGGYGHICVDCKTPKHRVWHRGGARRHWHRHY